MDGGGLPVPERRQPTSASLASPSPLSPIFLAGPTAAGKSAAALLLAEQLGGEIISVDSMQVYRGLDIGTAKPTAEERRRVPHHLIDVIDLTDSFDVAQFVRRAGEAVETIQGRGRIPIFCGGTGLYFKAFLEGLGETPPSDPALRARLAATPLADLLRELEERDPIAFAKIDRRNFRRVLRALEVIHLTGQPFSAQRAEWEPRPDSAASGVDCPRDASRFFCFSRSNDDLRARIDARVDDMFGKGLVEETERLLAQGLAQNETALQALGYRQVVEHLRSERPLAETVALIKVRTRRFAKRQMTWFRRQLQAQWIDLSPQASAESAAAQVQARLQSSSGLVR